MDEQMADDVRCLKLSQFSFVVATDMTLSGFVATCTVNILGPLPQMLQPPDCVSFWH